MLPHLAGGSPTFVALPRAAEINLSDRFEIARRIESRGEFVCQRLVLGEAVLARGANGSLVKTHGLLFSSFEPGNLRGDQCGSILEVRGTILGPCGDLSLMRKERLKMPGAGAGKDGVTTCGSCERGVEMVLRKLKETGRCPEEVLRFFCRRDGRFGVARQKARL